MNVVSLLTDFGVADQYVGVMKGVILGICPEARIVDITHEVGAYGVRQAGFVLEQAWRYFPKGTVHVVVVDPGVGSARRPILAEADGHRFVAPDNGVLTRVLEGARKATVRHITAERLFRTPVSQTFHGRDIFAPVGAHLAAGVKPASVGRRVDDFVRLTLERPVRTARRGWTGAVIHIDRFGNLVTNFAAAEYPWMAEQPFEVLIGMSKVTQMATSYAGAPGGEFVIAGSGGLLEISANQSSAAARLGVGVGAPVEIRLL